MFIKINGCDLEYYRYGKGKDTVIFSSQHVGGTTEDLFHLLAKSFQVFAINLPTTISPDSDPNDPWYPT
jgi:hypothetical protein